MNTKICKNKLLIYTSINENVKKMSSSKFKVGLVVLILSMIVFVGSTVALLTKYYTIPTSGSIGPLISLGDRPVAHSSEIRGVFFKVDSMSNPPNWNVVMDTLLTYGINTIILEIMGNNYAHYPSQYIPHWPVDDLGPAITAAHERGVKLYISMNVMLSALNDTYRVVAADGTIRDWLDPTNPKSRSLLRNLVEEVTSNYDIDGFMFDYVRYDMTDVPYGLYAKQSLEQYLGETIVNWPGDFAPGGSRYKEFMEWRPIPLNELVRDMRNWMLAIKPDLEITAAVWGWEPGWQTFNRYYLGQDSAYWVKEGYLDWVAPMQYTSDVARIRSFFDGMVKEMVAGPEGKIPLAAFIATKWSDPTNFKSIVDAVREVGTDGWIIFAYGGPGEGYSYAPDIRQYLDLIDLYPRFSLKNINASSGLDSYTVTWTTDLPANSKVEYSTAPLFTASFAYHVSADFHYWNITRVQGTIVEDSTLVTNHSLTLSGLQPGITYYFRVQSRDQNGIATSQVYTFQL